MKSRVRPDRMSWSWSSTLITASAIPFLVILSLITPLIPLWIWGKRRKLSIYSCCCRCCWLVWFPLQTDLLHVNQQRLLVVLPLDGKLTGMRELVTGQLHGHLEAVGVHITEVIHTCRKDKEQRTYERYLLVLLTQRIDWKASFSGELKKKRKKQLQGNVKYII